MVVLWLGIGFLSVLAVAFLFLPLLSVKQTKLQKAPEREAQNIEIFREQLLKLEQAVAAQELSQADADVLKLELEQNLLHDVAAPSQTSTNVKLSKFSLVWVLGLAILLSSSALGLYSYLGRSADLALVLEAEANFKKTEKMTLAENLAMLKSELAQRPDNAEGWYILGVTYIDLKRYEEGLAALQKSLKLLPKEDRQYPMVLGQYAQAKFFANNNKFNAEIKQIIAQSLAIDEFEMSALGLLGIDAFERADYKVAIGYWRKALTNAQSNAASSLESGIAEAEKRLGIKSEPVAKASLHISLSIAPELQSRVKPDQRVFVFARPVGQRMPVAAIRLSVADLPKLIELNDSHALTPQAKLSDQKQVELYARISQTGQPTATLGDLYAILSPIKIEPKQQRFKLVINSVVQADNTQKKSKQAE